MIKLCPRNYMEDIYPYAKFHCNIFTGSCPPSMWNITLLWLFIVLSCPGYTFFSQLSHIFTINHLWLKWRVVTRHPRMCLLRVWMTTYNTKKLKKTQKTKKGAWLGVFQPKWQNFKIVISPAGNIGSIPNFDRVIEPLVDFVGGPE